jgi:hypothetical protein
MNDRIVKNVSTILLSATLMLCVSCTSVKCEADKLSCKWDCPETIGLKQVCEQKCNLQYDLCKNK